MNTRRMITMLALMPLIALALMACVPVAGDLPVPTYSPTPLIDPNNVAAYAAAQATLAAGQNEIANLVHQATLVSLDMQQAAQAAAQTTLEANQRRLLELSIQGTEVSQNMALAAATQQFFVDQTQTIWDATASAQSQAATATYGAYYLFATQTAQALVQLDVQSTQVAQWSAAQRVYELTTTPWAAAQAEIAQNQNESARQSWWKDFIFNPLRAILFTMIILLVIAGGVSAYWRLMPVLELRLRTLARTDDSPLILLDGTSEDVTFYPQSQLPGAIYPTVEVVGPTEPSIINWVTEAEQKLRPNKGGQL